MKNFLLKSLLLSALVCGCSQEEIFDNQSISLNDKKVTAGFDQSVSRTYIEEGNLLRWTTGDKISLFYGNTLNQQYLFDGDTGDNAGTFSPVPPMPVGTGNDLSRLYAVYPYSSDTKITENGIITTLLPAKQSYAENSFGVGANTMVAATANKEDTFLKFKNAGGYLMLKLYGDNVAVKSISIEGNNNEKISGNAVITPMFGSEPTINMADDATETVTLYCGENGVEIGTTVETATAFWIVLPPTSFESGFTVKVVDVNDDVFTQSTSNNIAIERNVIKPMSALKVIPQFRDWFNPNQYITYVENYESVWKGDDLDNCRSFIECPVTSNIGKIELKFKMSIAPEGYKSYYLSCENSAKDYCDYIELDKNGVWLCDEEDAYIYLWSDLNVVSTDCIILKISFIENSIKLNGANLEYLLPSGTKFTSRYLFTKYYGESDEGYYRSWNGLPEGSKLYYVKIWDENDNLIYLGAASTAQNPNTNNLENCWKSYYNGEYNYEFAYYSETLDNYQPYGGGVD